MLVYFSVISSDLEIYQELQFFSLSEGTVLLKSVKQPIRNLTRAMGAAALAYDWLGKTLYQTCPMQNKVGNKTLIREDQIDEWVYNYSKVLK